MGLAKLGRTKNKLEVVTGRRLLSLEEASARLSMSRYTLRDWALAGKVASHRLGSRRMIADAEVERIIAESECPRVA